MSRREQFSIRKSHCGAISTCIAVLSLFSLAGLNFEVKADEQLMTSADFGLVGTDSLVDSESQYSDQELTTISSPSEEEVAVTRTVPEQETILELQAQLVQAKEEVYQAGQNLERSEAIQAQAKSDLDRVQVAVDKANSTSTEIEEQTGSRFEDRVVGYETKTEVVGTRVERQKIGEVSEGTPWIKSGAATFIDNGNEGVYVNDDFLNALKDLANGTKTGFDVYDIVRNDASLYQQAWFADRYNFKDLYENKKLNLSHNDKETLYDVLDLPYEVRKDLTLFYVALVNDIRAQVGTPPLKVTETSINEAYTLVDKIREEGAFIKTDLGFSENLLKGVPRNSLEALGYFEQTGRGSQYPSPIQVLETGYAIKEVSENYSRDIIALDYGGEKIFEGLQESGLMPSTVENDPQLARYQTIEMMKYGIYHIVGQQIYGSAYKGWGMVNRNLGGLNWGSNGENIFYNIALWLLGLDGNNNNTVGLDISMLYSNYHALGSLYIGKSNQVFAVFSNTDDQAIFNPYESAVKSGETRVVDVFEKHERPIVEEVQVPITERVEVPIYTTKEVVESASQELLDALKQAQNNHKVALENTNQAQMDYQVAKEKLSDLESRLATLLDDEQEDLPATGIDLLPENIVLTDLKFGISVELTSDKKITHLEILNHIEPKEENQNPIFILSGEDFDIYEIILKDNDGNRVSQLSGSALVKIPFDEGKTVERVIYLPENGDAETLAILKQENGFVYFETNHFSHYGVVYLQTSTATETAETTETEEVVTTPTSSDKAVSTIAQAAASSASTPSYSRVERATEKALPKTGEVTSLVALIGAGLSALGLTGLKRRQK